MAQLLATLAMIDVFIQCPPELHLSQENTSRFYNRVVEVK